MSATGRSDFVRDPDDFFATPAWVVDSILPHLAPLGPNREILEPAAGKGAILERLLTYGVEGAFVTGIEIDRGRAKEALRHDAAVIHADFLEWAPGLDHLARPRSFDCVITNPPFRLAMAFVEASFPLVAARRGEIAMLLRMNWLSSQERRAFHLAHPSDIYVLPRRPSFAASLRCKAKCGWAVLQELELPRAKRCPTCDGGVLVSTSDSTEYAWFVWGPGRGNRWFLLDEPAPPVVTP